MLELRQNGTPVQTVEEGGWLRLPNGDSVSPALAGWSSGEYELVALPPLPTPTPEEVLAQTRQNMTLSFAQLLIGLVAEGWITEADGSGWLVGALPAPVLAVISTLPANQQFAAKARATAPSYVRRTDPLVIALATSQGKSATQLDAFFTTYANV